MSEAPSTATGRRSSRSRGRSNGEGTVFEDKPNRRWVGMITVGWEFVDDGKGGQKKRQIRKSVSGPTKRDVMLKLRQFQRNADAGVPVPDQQITVGAMLDQWVEDVLPGSVAKPTEQQYSDVVRLYVKPRLGKKKLRDLTPTDVTRMLRDMEQPTDSRPNGYSQNARRLARSVLRRAIRWAEVEGMVSRNVAALANPVRVERPEGRTMTPEQARVFLDHIKGDRNEALFTVALTLGLRVSELLAVSWDDVNLDPPEGQRATLSVRRGINRVKGQGLVIGEVKTKTSRRTVHLPTATTECLREHRRRQDAEALGFPGTWPERPLGFDLVFRSAAGTSLDPSNVWHYLSEATQAAGLGHWHPHELRHSAGSLLLAQGVPLKMISEMLGHSSITVTADVYAHVLAPARDDVAAAMDRALASGAGDAPR